MKFGEKNVGMIDRILRGIFGVLFVTWGSLYSEPPNLYILVFVGIVLVVTGLFGSCSAYSLLNVNTLNCPLCNFMNKKKK